MSTDPIELPALVLRSLATVSDALGQTASVSVGFMSTAQRRESLLQLSAVSAQLESLRLRLIAVSGDVAADDGCRDVATWLSHHTRTDRPTNTRTERLAQSLDRGWPLVVDGLAAGTVNLAQAEVIVRGLEKLPDTLDPDILAKAEAHLVEAAATFGPRELRVIARRVLDVVAPELGEEEERKALEAEEAHARRTTVLRTRRLDDGTTEMYARIPDAVASRLLTYLEAFTSPRRDGAVPKDDRVPYDRKLGQAFCSLLENLDPKRMPLHGGDATTMMVMIDYTSLKDGHGAAGFGPDGVITASDARRLACNANIIPIVLGGESEILDLGRTQAPVQPAPAQSHGRPRPCLPSPGLSDPRPMVRSTPLHRTPGPKAAKQTSPTGNSSATSTTTEPTTPPTHTPNYPAETSDSTDADRRSSRESTVWQKCYISLHGSGRVARTTESHCQRASARG